MRLRRRKDQPVEPDTEAVEETPAPAAEPDAAADPDAPPPVAEYDRAEGPFDLSEADEADPAAGQRIDLGCLQIPMLEGLEIRVEVEQTSNEPVAVTLVKGEGAVQVRAFAAPRSGGAWAEAYRDIRQQLISDGGTVDEFDGRFGSELRATVAAQDEHGRQVMQRIRFIGVDGPRWMLQGIFFGVGTDPATAGELEGVYRSLVVNRGDTAMPMGRPLPVVLPNQVPDEVEAFEEIDDEAEPDPER